jgi:nascent polypeptide-associated complex subunit alpha
MIPGGARNSREMAQMMRRLGMTSDPIPDVEEVVIRTRSKEHVFQKPEVTILTVQGVRSYQIVGQPVVRPRGAEAPRSAAGAVPAPTGPPEEDVRLVMEQANVSREEALEALLQAKGEPAEAIMKILTRSR